MNNNIKVFSTVVVVVLLVLAAYFFIAKDDVVPEEGNTTPTATTTDTTVGYSPDAPGFTPVQALAYADALKKYASKRLQVTPTCQITPNNVTYKNGTTIMIDNRSDKAKSIKIGSTFSVPAYGFKIVTLSSATLPATYLIDCDKQQNAGTIILQK
jgi:hypothetical protein